MRISSTDIPVKVDAPGAVARQLPDFGTADVVMGAEHFSLAKGTDLAPLLEGLEHDLCQAQHWGYVIAGVLVVTYADGTDERCVAGDLVHWPAGHTVRVDEDAELILFSPADAHGAVLDHIAGKVAAA